MKRFLLFCLLAGAAPAQIRELATNADGRTLLFRTGFRMQSEPDQPLAGKIYQWRDGTWTRLAAVPERYPLVGPDVYEPFLTPDGAVYGWHAFAGCGLCQIIVAPLHSAVMNGVTLPPSFPTGNLRMSANARFFVGDAAPLGGAKHLDAGTGVVTEVPVSTYATPVVREIGNDGTVLLLWTETADAAQIQTPGWLVRWKPGAAVEEVYRDMRITGVAMSADGRRVAIETVVEGGPDDDERALLVLDLLTQERIAVSALPKKDVRYYASMARPRWDGNGTHLLYRSGDTLALWDVAARSSRTLLAHAEGIADAVISADGTVVWAVTNANRLLRVAVETAESTEILPALGTPRGAASEAIPGSAVLIRGDGFDRLQTVLDGEKSLPVAGAGPEGIWVQTPWEYGAADAGAHRWLLRSAGNPFESYAGVAVSAATRVIFARNYDDLSDQLQVKAVHQDYSSLVSAADPARPGETLHIYLTGLGTLDRPVPTGTPGPFQPHARPLTPFACYARTDRVSGLHIPFLAYAGGLMGIYQADITLPDELPDGMIGLLCTTDNITVESGLIRTRSTP